MRWFRPTWMLPLMIAVAAAPLVAQAPTGASGDAAADPAVDATAYGAETAEDRSVVIRFLERDDVRSVASRLRIDTDELAGRVDEMSPAQQAKVADRARELDQNQAAAENITLSTTTIIVGLLVLILLILIL